MDPADVVEFLLLSRTFPRSVLFCLRQAERDLARLDAGERSPGPSASSVASGPTSSSATSTSSSAATSTSFLDRVQEAVRQVAEAVGLQYFRNLPESTSTRSSSRPTGAKGADGCDSTSATARGSTTTTWCASRRTSCAPAR